jgi:ABC-2 type transport system permease protein
MRERARRVATAARLLLKDLLRRRIALVLLFVVPALFDAVVLVTTATRDVDVTIASLADELSLTGTGLDRLARAMSDDGTRTLDERKLSLVFLGAAAVSFLACFLAFNLVHKRRDVDARLVLAGYRAHEVLLAKLVVLLTLVAALATYEAAILSPWVAPHQLGTELAGFFFGGLIYGCLGMLVGALVKHELEGIFAIVFLTNIDAGWLQNPIYYAHSHSQALIRALPGYGPVQLAVAGALGDEAPRGALSRVVTYAAIALAAALVVFGLRIRPARQDRSERGRLVWHYAKVLAVAYAIWLGTFEVVGRYAATLHTVDLTSAWDRATPLIPAFVWPYEACYVMPLLSLFVMKDWHRFNVALVAFIVANATAFVVYVAVPIAYARPELGSSLAEKILAMEYAADFHPGANKLPSMHVAMSWIMVCAMWRQSKRRWVDLALAGLASLITVAAVFVKQHLWIDVIVGLPWGLASYAIANVIYRRVVMKDETAREALSRIFVPRPFSS